MVIKEETVRGKCKSCNKIVDIVIVTHQRNNVLYETPICSECGAEGWEELEYKNEVK